MDRPLLIAFVISLACHTSLLGFQLIHVNQQIRQQDRKKPAQDRSKLLNVVYEVHAAEQEVLRLQRQLAKMEAGQGSLPGIANPGPQIRIPDRGVLNLPASIPEPSINRSSVVDLTNLVEAAQGDPVLLSYFSAIRERIQSTANKQTWMAGPQDPEQSRGTSRNEGLVYISFVLSATGQVQSPQILADRSESSRFLQDIALKIIRGSNPFPPFPPSLKESSRTVVVPLEFLLGSQAS